MTEFEPPERALFKNRSSIRYHLGDDEPLCGTARTLRTHRVTPGDVPCGDCLAENGIYQESVTSATLTRNGSNSLITTIPCEIWRHAGIDIDDPGSVRLDYDPDEKLLLIDLNQPETYP